jgi:hypothetical protein
MIDYRAAKRARRRALWTVAVAAACLAAGWAHDRFVEVALGLLLVKSFLLTREADPWH